MLRRAAKHLAFVVHGERASRADVRHLAHWVRGKGHLVELMVTVEKGDGAALASAAARRGVDAVIAVGGDGTVNEVVNGLDGFDVPLGIIPLGTANDFARQVGIPHDANHAMDVILRRKPRRLDTASLNGRRFLNVSTGGLAAEAGAETGADAKQTLGPIAYALTSMRKIGELRPKRARFVADGFVYDGEFLTFAVGVTRATGGGNLVTPRASITDGLLDLCVIEHMSRWHFARTLLKVKRGDHVGGAGVHYAQARHVLVESSNQISVNVDGELARGTRLQYHARARDLWVHVVRLPGH